MLLDEICEAVRKMRADEPMSAYERAIVAWHIDHVNKLDREVSRVVHGKEEG